MSFTISYDIKAIDHYTAISEKITKSALKMDAAVKKIAPTNARATASIKKMDTVTDNLNRAQSDSISKMKKVKSTTITVEKAKDRLAKAEDRLIRAKKRLIAISNREAAANKRAATEANNRTRAIGSSMTKIGSTLTTRVAAPMILAGVAAFKMSSDMNEGMGTIATLLPGQSKRVQELKGEIQALAIETGIATSDLTEGAYSAISAWGDSAETMSRMRIVAQASKAGLASTSETLGLLSSITEIYGDNSAEATQRVADLAFVTNKLAIKAPFAEMASSMGRVAPLAKQIGLSQEALFATMGSSAGVGVSVSEVSTQMASLYTSIIKTTPAMEKVVTKTNAKLGTSFKTASEAMKSLGTVGFLEQMRDNTEGTKGMMKALGGRKEGMLLALSLLNSRTEKYNEIMKEMKTNTGQATEAYKEFVKTNEAGERWKRTQQKMIVLAQRMGDALIPVADKIMDKIEGITGWLGRLDPKTAETAAKVAWFALKAGLLFTVLGKIVGLTGSVSTFFSATGSGAAMAATKITGIGSAASALGPLMASFGAGWAIGTALNDFVIDPLTDAAGKLTSTVQMMLIELDRDLSILNKKEITTEKQRMEKKLEEMSGFGATVGSVFSGDLGADFRQAKADLSDKLIEVTARQLYATDPAREKEAEDRLDAESMHEAEMAGLGGGRGGGGAFPYRGDQRIKLTLDVNDPDNVISGADAKGDKGIEVDLGENLRD